MRNRQVLMKEVEYAWTREWMIKSGKYPICSAVQMPRKAFVSCSAP